MTQSYDMFIDLLSPVVVFMEMGLEIIAEQEEHWVIMCMKGRKNRFRAVSGLCEFVVSYVNTWYFCF